MSLILQILLNGIMLGGIYACVAVGFSLVWGVLNIINMLHGSFVILGGYATWYAWRELGVHPFAALLIVAPLIGALGWVVQKGLVNHVVDRPVLTTLTLTFGLDMILYNFMTVFFTATPRRIILDLGRLDLGFLVVPYDRVAAFVLAIVLTGLLYAVMRRSGIGRAIVAVRMDKDAARLMGIDVGRIYAATFGIGALMAGACGSLIAMVFPISPGIAGLFLGKAFVICVIGGLGSVPGALVGGLALGIVESFAGHFFGPQNAITVGFLIMMVLLMTRPTGLLGRKGYE